MNGTSRRVRGGVTLLEHAVDDNALAMSTLQGLGWTLGCVGGDRELVVSLMWQMKHAGTLGTVYANPRFVVRAAAPTARFMAQARWAQRTWLQQMKQILGSGGQLKREIKQRPPLLRQLEFTGVLVVDGLHIAPQQWPTGNQPPADPINLVGRVFGRLVVVTKGVKGRWECRCRCGSRTTVRAKHLLHGKTKSCGCLKAEFEAWQRSRKFGRS